ncbi:hypothetical protein [Bradyrhizobium sp. SZCCHNR1070]|uniref:hypothetical protein n=1 Tax=Bradyrhizobium sp. SZCCHNR1070 TaxID=3057361 RepID=UPI002916CF30|nr:hypothetical protein [Bradyrhizobium sp. SZCCHNR1070]
MAGSTTLYAWTVPAYSSGSPVDHTWVTTYDNRTSVYQTDADVIAAGQFYWYCWGSFHPTGGTPVNPTGFLGSQGGNLAFAQCLVLANADSRTTPAARGTIFVYGVDGVCHQLANQVLYATGSATTSALTVRGARGYMVSTFLYGTYGLQHAAWAAKIAACSSVRLPPQAGGMAMTAASTGPSAPDEFERHAGQVLGAANPKLLELLRLRSDVHQFVARAWPGTGQPSADALNARNQHMLDEAAKLLDPAEFKAIFGIDPGDKIDLVDPGISQTAGQIPKPRTP